MKKVIIAEKPKVAKAIIKALKYDEIVQKDGYAEGNNFIITNTFGHLFQLYDIEDYTKEENKRWKLDNLPFCPIDNKFNYKLIINKTTNSTDIGIKKQFAIIKGLLLRPDVDEIINSCDSDREGEVIGRLIVRNCIPWNSKKLTRLLLPDQTVDTIKYALETRKPEDNYDNWANEGFTRMYEDWLYGINLTRLLTLYSKTLLRVGRVLTAIVKAIYDREIEIEQFTPIKYYSLVSKEPTNGQIVELISKKKFPYDKQLDALEQCGLFNNSNAKVIDITTKKTIQNSKKLFSTTTLQNSAVKLYKIQPKECIQALQNIYEAGYITYPRTSTEYLTTAEIGRVKQIISVMQSSGYQIIFKNNNTIFDDSKVVSHSALTPTHKLPTNLTGIELKIYELIRNRFLSVFCSEERLINRTTMKIQCADEVFNLHGDVCISEGFYKYEKGTISDKQLPNLKINDTINALFTTIEKETNPPNRYTVETLNNFMESPFKSELKLSQNDESSKYEDILNGIEIGTVSSRTDILEKAKINSYISLDTNYKIEPLGRYMIEALDNLKIDMSKEKTILMSKQLKQVYNGTLTIDEAINNLNYEIKHIFNNLDTSSLSVINETVHPQNKFTNKELTSIGKCPLCGSPVFESKSTFHCKNNTKENKRCTFYMLKEDSFIKSRTGKALTLSHAKAILKNGCFKEKALKKNGSGTYNLLFKLKIADKYINWETELPKFTTKK